LGVTAAAPSLKEAVEKAYRAAEEIRFEKAYYRKDIGKRRYYMVYRIYVEKKGSLRRSGGFEKRY
jgi:hypothetical protein